MRLPQARDFDRLRRLLELIAYGLHNRADLGQQMGAKAQYAARHADYYREAAEILGLLEQRRWSLTARGRGLLATKPKSEEERELLRAAVADATDLGAVRHALLSDAPPDLNELVEYALTRVERGSRATVERRVKDILSWRARLGLLSPAIGQHVADIDPSAPDIDESQIEREPQFDDAGWPTPTILPFNWRATGITVAGVVFEDLCTSDEALLVMGYASLEELCDFVSMSKQRGVERRLRVVFGTEPFRGRAVDARLAADDLSADVREYWLEQGISILSALSVLHTIEAIEAGAIETRISFRSQGLHAKMFLAGGAATIGSSNFTGPGLRTQLEANVRLFKADNVPNRYFSEAWRLGEVYWKMSRPYDHELRDLLETLLQKVTWQEALARGCAELLEGQWARAFLRNELGYGALWPSQVQGIGQALYVLMEVGSVLIADATGSGKTKMGAWLLHALRQRLVTQGRPISDPVLVSPPAVNDRWADELRDAEIRVEVYSQGALSSPRAAKHARVVSDVEVARILVLDEAHNFVNPSNRTAKVNTTLADHVMLFTATPISRDVSDLLGIADLLGADNLDEETVKIIEEAGWRRRRVLTDTDRIRLRQAVKRFTVRRTKRAFNALIDREPNRYRNEQGVHCRYPEHRAHYYELNESDHDRHLAGEITRLARLLRGVVMLRRPLELTPLHKEWGHSEESYMRMRLASARALARHQLRAALRSSRAALYEHIHGTKASIRQFAIRQFEKDDSGDILAKVIAAKQGGPPRSDLQPFLPDWLLDRDAFERTCDEEYECYRQVGELCCQLSNGREVAKVEQLTRLIDEHRLVVAFDSRPITLFLLRDLLGDLKSKIFVATGGRNVEQRNVLNAFAPGTRTRSALALCSNSMSEGINLQRASAVIHLDMPSVVRVAEQRVGRIDRMDSLHGDIESWWPRDAAEFALAADERLAARLELVGDVFGANLQLPSDDSDPAIVPPESIEEEMREQEARQVELLDDAFSPVRNLVDGPQALIGSEVYGALRTSKARVVSSVAAVRANSPWIFLTLPGTGRVAPRWVLIDGMTGSILTALDDVAQRLREQLADVEDIPLDQGVVNTMQALLARAEASVVSLLPRRKQRAFEQMGQVLAAYREDARMKRNQRRARLVEELLAGMKPEARTDLDVLLDAWLAVVRPRWRAALQSGMTRRRRATLRRLRSLTGELQKNALTEDELTGLLDAVQAAKPLAERVVAAIIGVPA